MADRIVGFTGSRAGITSHQRETLKKLLLMINPIEAHHGECIGSDAAFHGIVQDTLPECHIVGHPPKVDTYRVVLSGYFREEDRRGYQDCGGDIVQACTLMVVCVKSHKRFDNTQKRDDKMDNRYRTTPWHVINLAKDAGRELVVVYPDGMVERTEARN